MRKDAKTALLGVDVGGTFTDAVLVHGGNIFTAKLPTTPEDQSKAVLQCAKQVLAEAGVDASSVGYFAHGMTVATNALLEERGARTGMLATEGFADLVDIGRQDRPELYRPCEGRPRPLTPPELRRELPERASASGVMKALDGDRVADACGELAREGIESLAICLLFSFSEPQHERLAAKVAAEYLPGVHISTSHEVVGEFREYERFSTTLIDAYLSPLLATYLESLSKGANEAGLPEPVIMQSNGGVIDVGSAARHASWAVLSGPAGGAQGSAYIGELSGQRNLVGIDMGGTSCDVCQISDGKIGKTSRRTIGGRPLQLPMLDVHTVGAGGGSVAWRDSGGALRVGPQSAGAVPGPACYGQGGNVATVTDANLMLGYLSTKSKLAGGVELDRSSAEKAVTSLAQELGLSAIEASEGIVRVANQEMVRALRVVTVARGVDPRENALLAFGGAGPMHAAALATELDMKTVLCPRSSGVLSALGLVSSDMRRDLVRSVFLRGEGLKAETIGGTVDTMSEEACKVLGQPADVEVRYDLRYLGQSFELTVDGPAKPKPDELRESFERLHVERYGFTEPQSEIELVNIRVAAVAGGAIPKIEAAGEGSYDRSQREAYFDGKTLLAEVVTGEPAEGIELDGPAIYELPSATVVVPPGWRSRVDGLGTVILEGEV